MAFTDIILLLTALVSFIFSIAFYLHSRKTLVDGAFAFLALNFSIWSVSTFLVTSPTTPFDLFKLGAFTHYISGNLIFLSFLLLT